MKILKRLLLLFLITTLITANTFAGNAQPRENSSENGIPLGITDVDLAQFDSLLEYLSNHNVVELDFFGTHINDDQLANILNQIGENLRTLSLEYCENLNDFETIKNCTQLQELELSRTNITDDQLASILNQIGRNLRMLRLEGCSNLHNFEAIRNCTQLQVLDLSWTDINDEQLEDILNQIGGNLRALNLRRCKNLHNFEEIKNWVQKRNIKLYLN